MRYASDRDVMRRPLKGYEAPVCILTRQAARALSAVQKRLAADGMTLVVYDCYRPVRAVDDMARWSLHGGAPDRQWYPKLRRDDLVAEGYVATRSAHSRGSTVDLAVAPLDGTAGPPAPCGAGDASTLDFGTGFDCFDPMSETAHRPLGKEATASRKMLVDAMRAGGFANYAREWWHYTLADEPFAKERFDFPVTAE